MFIKENHYRQNSQATFTAGVYISVIRFFFLDNPSSDKLQYFQASVTAERRFTDHMELAEYSSWDSDYLTYSELLGLI